MTKAEQKKAAALGREDMEGIVRELCLASVRIDETTARMNEALARVRQKFEAELSALRQTFDEHFDIARAWADAHPEEFASRKSVVFVHGTLLYRTGQPALKTVRGVTWEKVLSTLKLVKPEYVRVREEIDKELLLADRDELGAENLGTLGVRVEQAERFNVEPNKEAVDKVRGAA